MFARNCGFGKILGAGFLEYLGRISGRDCKRLLLSGSCQKGAFRFRALPVASKSWRRFSNRHCHCRTYCSSTGFGLFRLTERKPLGTHDLICCYTATDNGLGMDALVIGCTQNMHVIVPLPPTHPPTQSQKPAQNRVRKSPRAQGQELHP